MKTPVKIQVLKDTSNQVYEVYKNNLWFRIFGRALSTVIAYGYSNDEAKANAKNKLFGTIIQIERTEIYP